MTLGKSQQPLEKTLEVVEGFNFYLENTNIATFKTMVRKENTINRYTILKAS